MIDGRSPLQLAERLGLALAMAVFMGLAFEGIYKREGRWGPGGIRTFPLLALLGTVLYVMAPGTLLPYLVGLGGLGLWLFAHLQTTRSNAAEQPSLIIPTANLLAYTLGPLALSQPPWFVIAVAVAAVLLLEGREVLHGLVQKVAPEEAYTLGKFLILVGIVLPLVPDRPIASWTPITPFEIWLALVAVSSLSYLSYLLQRYLPHRGTLVPSILGGAYSSTATTVALAREQKAAGRPRPELAVGIILATAVMYLRLDVVIALFNRPLAWLLLPRVAVLSAIAGILSAWQWLRRGDAEAIPAGNLGTANPLQLLAAVTFAVLFVVVALTSSWVRSRFGATGVYALGGIAGVSDINPFVLSLAQGSVAGMSVRAVGAAILIAAASNNMMNAVYALVFGGGKDCRRPALALCITAAAGLGVALLTLPR